MKTDKARKVGKLGWAALLAGCAVFASGSAMAQHSHGGFHGGHGGHGHVVIGVGVGVGPWYWPWYSPYYYPYYPAYPYYSYYPPAAAAPPSYIEQQAAPASADWYYCEGSRAYYPYVKDCPGGWERVPAQPAH
jgi:hypothetical protein